MSALSREQSPKSKEKAASRNRIACIHHFELLRARRKRSQAAQEKKKARLSARPEM